MSPLPKLTKNLKNLKINCRGIKIWSVLPASAISAHPFFFQRSETSKIFPTKKKLNSYFGVIPSVRQSNNKVYYGRITKRGSRMVRATLVQCTLSAINHNQILKPFYLKLKARKGSGKAIVATARKLLELIYYTLSNNIVWEDSNHGVIKT